GALVFPAVNWLGVFPPTTGRFVGEIAVAFAVVFLGFVSSVLVSFIGPLYAARQELHLASVPSFAAGLLTFAGTVAAIRLDLGLTGVVVAGVGLTSAAQLSFAFWTLYLRAIPEIRPRWSACSR